VLQTSYPNNVAQVIGEARTLRFDIEQGGGNEDAEIYEFGIKVKATAPARTSDLTG